MNGARLLLHFVLVFILLLTLIFIFVFLLRILIVIEVITEPLIIVHVNIILVIVFLHLLSFGLGLSLGLLLLLNVLLLLLLSLLLLFLLLVPVLVQFLDIFLGLVDEIVPHHPAFAEAFFNLEQAELQTRTQFNQLDRPLLDLWSVAQLLLRLLLLASLHALHFTLRQDLSRGALRHLDLCIRVHFRFTGRGIAGRGRVQQIIRRILQLAQVGHRSALLLPGPDFLRIKAANAFRDARLLRSDGVMAEVQNIRVFFLAFGSEFTVQEHDTADRGERSGLGINRREEGLKDGGCETLQTLRHLGVLSGVGRVEVVHDQQRRCLVILATASRTLQCLLDISTEGVVLHLEVQCRTPRRKREAQIRVSRRRLREKKKMCNSKGTSHGCVIPQSV
ncbi:hypothetical protein ASPCADRAFT_514109 [Aspergillus carbonarius ITEM 5010]|uniref:Uncharacterized protein n=1 Tax=Aspergillus carbonarius (strain ITEM 5010) TaxID=602072 RepID=A0A1R3RRG4_ASPC5|nr:hypothetical protein ASPCADRAFT_514109 [Aspergillus carbonarius ITEM 5010]